MITKGERKMRKLTVAAIIAVIAAGVFTGCGNAAGVQGGGTGNSPAGQTSGQTSGQASGQASGQTENTGNSAAQGTQNNGGQDIGEDAALQAALKAAGVSEADASRVLISMDRDDGMTLYEVRFDAGGTEYDYEIQASDGQVVSSDLEKIRDDGRGGNASTAVSREQAMETALAKVPGAAEKDIRIELDYDDGRYRYEGDIIYDRVEYDFEIDADSGEIVEWSEERN